MKKFNATLNILTGALIGLILILLDSIDITYIISSKFGLSFGIFEKGILSCIICLSTFCFSLKFGEIIKEFNIDLKNKIIVNSILAFFIFLIYSFNSPHKSLLLLFLLSIIIFIIIPQLIRYTPNKKIITKEKFPHENLALSDLNTQRFLDSKNYVITDSPIGDKANDIININIFIESLLEYIKRINTIKSFRVGLIGKWGVGKTSIVNLLKNKNKELNIGNTEEEIIVFIDFSPWKYDNIKEMMKILYEKIAQNISNNYSNIHDKILLEKYKRYINSLLNNKIGFDIVFEEESEFAKKEIENIITNSNKKFVVVIDDIDRLKSEQIKHLFDFVYNILDFNRIIFIMCYDEKKINRIYNEEYNYYFDKVINSKIYVPTIQRETLEHIFKYGIYSYIKKHKLIIIDEAELDKVINIISEEFDDIRSISEFFNILEFDLIISEKNDLYLNDVIALSFIKYKYHNLYMKIYNNSRRFIKNGAAELNICEEKYPDTITELIEILFPASSILLLDKNINTKNKRICDENFFINYFSQGRNKYLSLYINAKEFISNLQNKENRKESITKFFNKYDSIEIKLLIDILIVFYDRNIHDDLFIQIILNLQNRNINIENFLCEFLNQTEHPFKIIKEFSSDIFIMDKLYYMIENGDLILDEKDIKKEGILKYINDVMFLQISKYYIKNKNIYNKKEYKKGQSFLFVRCFKENNIDKNEYEAYIRSMLSKQTIFRILYDCIVTSEIEDFPPYAYRFVASNLLLLGISSDMIDSILNEINIKNLNDDKRKIIEIYKNKYNYTHFNEKIDIKNL